MLFIDTRYLLHKTTPFLFGWLGDRLLGDPEGWPHPIVWFGKAIAYGERHLNRGNDRILKGGILAVTLIAGIYFLAYGMLYFAGVIHPVISGILTAIGVFFCLAGKTLITEVKAVFEAVDRSVEEGRTQVGRIVGRDTAHLSPQEIRAAALETLAENLSDGVIAPMFWFLLLGLPGMMAYKMINTLDSMIGYKNDRYFEFGRIAARIDDLANYLPARLTAFLMLLVSGQLDKRDFVFNMVVLMPVQIQVIRKQLWLLFWIVSSVVLTITLDNRSKSLISGQTPVTLRPKTCGWLSV